MKKKVDSKPVYSDDDRYMKTKIKSNRGTIYTNFHGKIPKENECQACLSVILIESIARMNKKYHPQTLLEECKYKVKKIKMIIFINNDLDLDSSYHESDDESDDDSNESVKVL